jgi:hypothetical protein
VFEYRGPQLLGRYVKLSLNGLNVNLQANFPDAPILKIKKERNKRTW